MGGEPSGAGNSDIRPFPGSVVSCTPNAGVADPYQQAIDSRHPDIASAAAFSLGAMLQQQGDLTAAHAAYQQAIDSGHRDQAPNAATALGILLQERGDITGARANYQRAAGSGNTEVASEARRRLRTLP
jgi:tetratricopeptide (TPR) repeat protein